MGLIANVRGPQGPQGLPGTGTPTFAGLAKPAGVTGNGSTDDRAAIQAALTGSIGEVLLPQSSYAVGGPIIVPNGYWLSGVGAMQGGTTLIPTPSFPHTTVAGGFTTPSDTATNFIVNVAATAGFPLGSGGISPVGGAGVACVAGITFFYTGTTSTSFTGCRVGEGDANVTVADGRAVSTFLVWLDGPGESSTGFGTRISDIGVNLGAQTIPGISGIHSSRIQEGGGVENVRVTGFRNFGIRVDHCPLSAGPGALNYGLGKLWVIFAAVAEAEAVGIDLIQGFQGVGPAKLDGHRGVKDATIVVQGNSAVVGKAGMRLNSITGVYQDIHLENMNDGILVGDKYRCSVGIENVWIGSNWGSGAGVRLANTVGNAARLRNIGKSSSATVGNRVTAKDDLNSLSFLDEQVDYTLWTDGSYSIRGGAHVGRASLRPAATATNTGLIWFASDTGVTSISAGSSWATI